MGIPVRQEIVEASVPARPLLAFMPALAAMSYPFWLQAAHALSGPLRWLGLLGAVAMPLAAGGEWLSVARRPAGSTFDRRARAVALLALSAPPLFVFMSFVRHAAGMRLPESVAWVGLWAALAAWVAMADPQARAGDARLPDARARVAHGSLAALLLAFVAYHLANHLAGLLGPQVHAAVMHLGRGVYRIPAVEAGLVTALLLQVMLGAALAWRWSARALDGPRALQVATGVQAGLFLLVHMNSALVSARFLNGTETDWAWASAAPVGLLDDAWAIRLLPHYLLGAFCVLAHLAGGLRGVLLAHGRPRGAVDLAWVAGTALSAVLAALIAAALCGLRFAS